MTNSKSALIAMIVTVVVLITIMASYAMKSAAESLIIGIIMQSLGLVLIWRGYRDKKRGWTIYGTFDMTKKKHPIAFWLTVLLLDFAIGFSLVIIGFLAALELI